MNLSQLYRVSLHQANSGVGGGPDQGTTLYFLTFPQLLNHFPNDPNPLSLLLKLS